MVNIEGIYEIESSENIENLIETYDIPYLIKQGLKIGRRTIEIKKISEDQWLVNIYHLQTKTEIEFRIGEPYSVKHKLGEPIKCFTEAINDTTWITRQNSADGKDWFSIVTEFTETHAIQTLLHMNTNTSAKRIYKRIK